MSDLIKKIKIKKQDGTYTDYIPIGAEAKNIDMKNGNSVEYEIEHIENDIGVLQEKNKKIFPNLGGVTYISNITNWNRDVKQTYQEFYNMGGRKAQIVQDVFYYGDTHQWKLGNTESLDCLRLAIQDIKNMGYEEIMVKIHQSQRNGGIFKNMTIAERRTVLADYLNILIQYANICQEYKIDIFVISNEVPELTTLSELVDIWTNIYTSLRKIYTNKISHSMTIEEAVNFKLYEMEDVICINSYPDLSFNPDADPYECSFSRDLDRSYVIIDRLRKYNKDIIMTETGCEHNYGRLAQPGYYGGTSTLDYQTQLTYFLTVFRYIKENAMYIKDIYMWELCYNFTFLDNEEVKQLFINIINGEEGVL